MTFPWLIMNLEKKLDLLFSLWVLMHSKQNNYVSGNAIGPCISFSNSEHTVAIMVRTVRDSLADASIMSDDIRGLLQPCCYKLTASEWHARTAALYPAALSLHSEELNANAARHHMALDGK